MRNTDSLLAVLRIGILFILYAVYIIVVQGKPFKDGRLTPMVILGNGFSAAFMERETFPNMLDHEAKL